MASIETLEELKKLYQEFSNFGISKEIKRGLSIYNLEKWLKQAQLIGRDISCTMVPIIFKQITKKKYLNFEEFQTFLKKFGEANGIAYVSVKELLCESGLPSITKLRKSTSSSSTDLNLYLAMKPRSNSKLFDISEKSKVNCTMVTEGDLKRKDEENLKVEYKNYYFSGPKLVLGNSSKNGRVSRSDTTKKQTPRVAEKAGLNSPKRRSYICTSRSHGRNTQTNLGVENSLMNESSLKKKDGKNIRQKSSPFPGNRQKKILSRNQNCERVDINQSSSAKQNPIVAKVKLSLLCKKPLPPLPMVDIHEVKSHQSTAVTKKASDTKKKRLQRTPFSLASWRRRSSISGLRSDAKHEELHNLNLNKNKIIMKKNSVPWRKSKMLQVNIHKKIQKDTDDGNNIKLNDDNSQQKENVLEKDSIKENENKSRKIPIPRKNTPGRKRQVSSKKPLKSPSPMDDNGDSKQTLIPLKRKARMKKSPLSRRKGNSNSEVTTDEKKLIPCSIKTCKRNKYTKKNGSNSNILTNKKKISRCLSLLMPSIERSKIHVDKLHNSKSVPQNLSPKESPDCRMESLNYSL